VRDADSKTTNSGWDSDDSDNKEEDEKVKVKTIKRAWAAWNVAEDALAEDPESFGPSSFGIIAMGTILELIKKLRTAY
jgi:RNA-dependent RNA polymerase